MTGKNRTTGSYIARDSGLDLLVGLAVLLFLLAGCDPNQQEQASASDSALTHPDPLVVFSDTDEHLYFYLRDQGIQNIGWVAGNASDNAIWPQVEPYVGKSGTLYKAFLFAVSPGADETAEVISNVDLYNVWLEKGEQAPHDEAACMAKTKETQDLAEELKRLLQKY